MADGSTMLGSKQEGQQVWHYSRLINVFEYGSCIRPEGAMVQDEPLSLLDDNSRGVGELHYCMQYVRT